MVLIKNGGKMEIRNYREDINQEKRMVDGLDILKMAISNLKQTIKMALRMV